jgi:DNA-binding NarL/FixJ family response regulator
MDVQKMLSEPALRSRIGVPPTDSLYDDIVSSVLLRLFMDSLKGTIPDTPAAQEARLNSHIRTSRINEMRRVMALEFQAEVVDKLPPEADFTADDLLDVIRKKATDRQQMVFALLAEGLTLQEVADNIGVAGSTVCSDKLKIASLVETELNLHTIKQLPR